MQKHSSKNIQIYIKFYKDNTKTDHFCNKMKKNKQNKQFMLHLSVKIKDNITFINLKYIKQYLK